MDDKPATSMDTANKDLSTTDATTSSLNADANAVKPNWLALPPEIWERIVEFVFPNIPTEQCMYPKPDARFSGDRYRANSLFTRSLVALALTCKQLNVIALQRVYRAVYLCNREDLDNFVDILCENGAGLLVPSTCENASWIRAIHMTNTITSESQDEFDAGKRRCLCDVHVVLSFADQLRYVSLACEDERPWSLADAVYPGSISNHPLTHFLSTKTRCRPRGLSLSLSGSNGSLERYIDMNSVTSFAPISQLSHLELIHMLPPDELIAFLIGNPDIADARGYLCELPCSVYDAIAAGLSRRLTLECLRFSHLPRDALDHFRTYVAWRTAEEAFFRLSPEQKALRAMPEPPASSQEQQDFQCALYNLASNSKNLPKLRLIILDFATKEMRVPNEPALDECVRVGLLQDMSATMPGPGRGTKESGRASNSVSPSFERSSAIPRKVIRKLKEADAGWARGLAEADEHWRMVKDGKDALLDLLRSSRQGAASESTDLVQSEVRIAADRNRWTALTRYERRAEFLGQAASFCHFEST